MAVVSEPANAIDTAIVKTLSCVMNSGRSVWACRNFERRSGFERDAVSIDDSAFDLLSRDLDALSAMRAFANVTTGKVASIMPHWANFK